jgi:hypothetical protein
MELRYFREVPNIHSLVWLDYLLHVSEDISASESWISLAIAALKARCTAIYFEYNKAYI